jgi:hypothetical protein
MKDFQASVEKLLKDAAEAALIRDLATDKAKRALFDQLHDHLIRLADEVQQAMKRQDELKPTPGPEDSQPRVR